MQTVKALKALPGRQEGSVFSVDESSAKVLKERGDVEFVEGTIESGGLFVRSTARSGAVTQVAEADYPELPEQVVGEPVELGEVVDGDGVTHTGTLPAELGQPTKNSNKADLVAYAARQGLADEAGNVYSEAELESLSKPELVAKLGL
ncbi:hypothetical protein [Mycolicibacterium senegalense]|uniref:Uncharacterized protein n=1 Tax=Mycolicibacterium senegalense TaxID=1796 RepID=A0ABR5G1M8_9MYCO|nr:hypothetical protein [Mycolicibacterium senegalense]KLI05790.1 hypothetical protein AA982_22820 [Mycolicibacterium senegalense]KLO54074.1 hypothetical protein ABW05_23990 [Mycolicibacterium senegalense]KLO54142.1 hypothetical protein ABW05_24425 [Mycolicibacterium senegalense]